MSDKNEKFQSAWKDYVDHWLGYYVGYAITLNEADDIRLWLDGLPPPVEDSNISTPLGLERQSAIEWFQGLVPFHPMLTEAPTGDALVALLKISDAVSNEREAEALAHGWSTRVPHTGPLSFTRL